MNSGFSSVFFFDPKEASVADEARARSTQRNWVAKIHSLNQLMSSQFWCFYDVVSDPKEAILADEAGSEVCTAKLG
jgi:hypothetical protein